MIYDQSQWLTAQTTARQSLVFIFLLKGSPVPVFFFFVVYHLKNKQLPRANCIKTFLFNCMSDGNCLKR